MSITTQSRSTMNITPNNTSMIISVDTVQGPKQGNWTYEDYAAIPDDGKRYQIVEGVLFRLPVPDKWHQKAVGRISRYLFAHIEDTQRGEVYIALSMWS